ncbi:MAG: hypothetical protein MUE30_08235 [Spirosomaceae bacterium]|nr:hypothetical protein [Spirosomataceae bacterium]
MKQSLKTLKSFIAGFLAFFVQPLFSQEGGGLTKLSSLSSVRVPKIDVQHIALDLAFDWVQKQAFGTVILTISPLNTTNTIELDAAKMAILAVSLNSNKALKYTYDGSERDNNLLDLFLN